MSAGTAGRSPLQPGSRTFRGQEDVCSVGCSSLVAKHEEELPVGLPQMSGVPTRKGQHIATCWTPVAYPSAYQAFWALVDRFHDQPALVWGEECNHDLH